MTTRRPNVFYVPPHRAFADALAAGVLDAHGRDRVLMARGLILLPNNRAVQAVRDAFVRQADEGLLLPRLVPIGDENIDSRLGGLLDPIDAEPLPPAIAPLHRQFILARLIQVESDLAGAPRASIDAAEAMRLAADLARTLDQLIVEGIDPRSLAEVGDAYELSEHWQTSLRLIGVILEQWPNELMRLQCIDLTDRRNQLLRRLSQRLRSQPPSGFVIAAGVSTTAPSVVDVLKTVARLENGAVVFAGLDLNMSDGDWELLKGDEAHRAADSHPQFHLHQLLDRMQVARNEVRLWRRGSDFDAPAQRSRALSFAMALPDTTAEWHQLAASDVRLSGVSALECTTPAHEAASIALALRHALESPEQTAALVTPDRDLARRVVALLTRWNILADDSAGLPLSSTPVGGLILATIDLLASDFAPVSLLTLLKHPLLRSGDDAFGWLDGARALDLALRGPRPAAGLAGIDQFLRGGNDRERSVRDAAAAWWGRVAPRFVPISALRAERIELPRVLAVLRDTLDTLAGSDVWAGAAGHAAANLFEQLDQIASDGPHRVTIASLPQIFRRLMDDISVRPNGFLHPRISIWGLLEAKLQTADVMILGGLNEGVWPALPPCDPWLAPKIRHLLGLPTLEHRIGLAGHDLVGAMGAKKVLLTRAKRDSTSPTTASRFWLRLQALSGGLSPPQPDYGALALSLDSPAARALPARRPEPVVPPKLRPRIIRVTELDTLNADPFAYYARAILKLSRLDLVDAEPSPSWRGSLIHSALQAWGEHDAFEPHKIEDRFGEAFARENVHPLLTTLWLPRFLQAAKWIAQRTSEDRQSGRRPIGWEVAGEVELCGVTLRGRLDRIDQLPDGSLVVLDYKTGQPPKPKQIRAGYALQLGLIGLMAERGAFADVAGSVTDVEYWSLGRVKGGGFGYAVTALDKGETARDFLATTEAHFRRAVDTWLIGDAPFSAKLVPEYAYSDYDQLMRYDEWFGRND
jgi:ATP-dependent helicase/nuclease subunit B